MLKVVDNDSKIYNAGSGKTNAYVNGSETTLAAAPILSNENTMFPLKATADALNVSLTENEGTKSIYISCTLPSILRNANGFMEQHRRKMALTVCFPLVLTTREMVFTEPWQRKSYLWKFTATWDIAISETGRMEPRSAAGAIFRQWVSCMSHIFQRPYYRGARLSYRWGAFRGTWYHNATTSATYPSVGQFHRC